jgi:hypothetical protein
MRATELRPKYAIVKNEPVDPISNHLHKYHTQKKKKQSK